METMTIPASFPSGSKPRFPRRDAVRVARELCDAIEPASSRLVVAGSLRRRKPEVGDVEIVYISRSTTVPDMGDLFQAPMLVNSVDLVLGDLQARGVLAPRRNSRGFVTMGLRNKLMVHCASGIPVDLFATTADCWANYLVCRTGGAETNIRIARAARARGMKWIPYGPGFRILSSTLIHRVMIEADVFECAGLPYLEPWNRP